MARREVVAQHAAGLRARAEGERRWELGDQAPGRTLRSRHIHQKPQNRHLVGVALDERFVVGVDDGGVADAAVVEDLARQADALVFVLHGDEADDRAGLGAGQRLGAMKLTLDGKPYAEIPVLALEAVPLTGVFGRGWDALRLLFK